MSAQAGGADGPDDVDAAFAEIVAGLERDGVTSSWPERDEVDEPPAGRASTTTALSDRRPSSDFDSMLAKDQQPAEPLPNPNQRDSHSTFNSGQQPAEDDHFVPPEPPPLPRMRPGTVVGVALVVLGVLLLVVPSLLGLTSRIGTPLALIALTGGIGWLVLRIRQGPPPDSGWDDGAQL